MHIFQYFLTLKVPSLGNDFVHALEEELKENIRFTVTNLLLQ